MVVFKKESRVVKGAKRRAHQVQGPMVGLILKVLSAFASGLIIILADFLSVIGLKKAPNGVVV